MVQPQVTDGFPMPMIRWFVGNGYGQTHVFPLKRRPIRLVGGHSGKLDLYGFPELSFPKHTSSHWWFQPQTKNII